MSKLEEIVLVTVKQKGAASTVKTLTGLSKALEEVELKALSMSETLDGIFDISSLTAYEAKVTSIAKTLQSFGPDPQVYSAILANLDDIVESTSKTAINSEVMTRNIGEMAQDMHILAENSDSVHDDFRDTARYSENTSEYVKETVDLTRQQIKLDKDRTSELDKQLKIEKQQRSLGNYSSSSGAGNSRNGGKAVSALLSNAGGLAAVYAVITANVYAAAESFRILSEAASDARLLNVSSTLSATKGVNIEVTAAAMRDVLEDAISYQESMALATATVAKGFSTEQLEQLTLVARRASVALGIDLTDAMNRVTKGIAKQEVELLDELGISIKLTEAFDAYALEIGSTADELSSYQRQQALTNLVLKKSEETLGGIDSVMRATEWEKFGASAATAMDKILQAITKDGSFLSNWLSIVNTLIEKVPSLSDKLASLEDTRDVAFNGSDLDAQITAQLAVMQASTTDAMLEQADALKTQGAAYRKEIQELTRQIALADKEIESKASLFNNGVENVELAAITAYRQSLTGKRNALTQLEGDYRETGIRLVKAAEELSASGQQATSKYLDYNVEDSGARDLQSKVDELQDKLFAKNLEVKQATEQGKSFIVKNLAERELGQITVELAGAQKALDEYTKLFGEFEAAPSFSQLELLSATGDAVKQREEEAKSTKSIFDNISKGFKLESSTKELDELINSGSKFLDLLSITEQLYQGIGAEQDELQAALSKSLESSGLGTSEQEARARIDDAIAYRDAIRESWNLQVNMDRMLATRTGNETGPVYATAEVDELTALLRTKSVKDKLHMDELTFKGRSVQLSEERAFWDGKDVDLSESSAAFIREQIALQNQINELIHQRTLFGFTTRLNLASEAKAYTPIQEAEKQLAIAKIESEQAAMILTKERSVVAAEAARQAEVALQNAQAALDQAKAGRESAAFAYVGGDIQSGNTMDVGAQAAYLDAENLEAGAAAFKDLTSQVTGLDALSNGLANLAAVSLTFGTSVEKGMAMASAGLSAVGGMLSMVSASAVTEIDHQIAMEEARDGTSEESLAKIKALNIQKIKEQKKAAQQSILINTAQAVMMAFATYGPTPWGFALAGAAAVAGGIAYQQASNASANSIAELNAGSATSSTSSIDVGTRDNSVDTSIAASSGEHDYLSGVEGTGTANSFSARSSGTKTTSGNTSFLVGDNGPELVSLPQQSTITSAEDTAKASGSTTVNYTFNVDAIDTQSLLDRKSDLFAAIEEESSQKGMSLYSLRNL
jgi:hypothetical protein